MMNWHIEWIIETRRRQEEMAEADRYRLLKSGDGSLLKPRPYQRWAVSLGGWMITQGQRLQTRYANLTAEPLGLTTEPAPEPCS